MTNMCDDVQHDVGDNSLYYEFPGCCVCMMDVDIFADILML